MPAAQRNCTTCTSGPLEKMPGLHGCFRQMRYSRWTVSGFAALVMILLIFTASRFSHEINFKNIISLSTPRDPRLKNPFQTLPSPDFSGSHPSSFQETYQGSGALQKPERSKVVALIFYGRKSRVEILRCYLERNLVGNGGWLDEIHWGVNTQNEADITYLHEITRSRAHHKIVELDSHDLSPNDGFNNIWSKLERNTYYVKIDDDVVYVADDTIARVVHRRMTTPAYLLVSANMINSPLLSWVHYHSGAIHPYLPELDKAADGQSVRASWLYADYPQWTGPDDYIQKLDMEPPYPGHRWLRLPDDADITRTPVTEIQYDTWGTGLKSWAIAAQEHYSFLENLADSRLDRYTSDKVWIADYQRLSVNFICVYSDDILDNWPIPRDISDEEWLTVILPKSLHRSVAVEMGALATHFSFGPQNWGVSDTDLLARYKDYSDRHVCHV
jgi:hypothetical protein